MLVMRLGHRGLQLDLSAYGVWVGTGFFVNLWVKWALHMDSQGCELADFSAKPTRGAKMAALDV